MVEILENRHLIQSLKIPEIIGCGKVSPLFREEIRLIKSEATAYEKDPLGRGCRLGAGGGTQVKRLQGEG
jgi:hypothetical protein